GDIPVVVPANATRVCLLAGDRTGVADPFIPRPLAAELQLCQRYYEKSYNLNDAPGSMTEHGRMLWPYNAHNVQRCTLRYVRKRVTPTATIYDTATGTTGKVILSTGTLVDAGVW